MISLEHRLKYGLNNFNKPSVVEEIDGKTKFFFFQQAKSVSLLGEFLPKGKQPMIKTKDHWEFEAKIPFGKNYYKFEIDGNQVLDEHNNLSEEHPEWGEVSVYFKPNFCFELFDHAGASQVFLAGNLNNWHVGTLPLHFRNDKWELPIYLPDGTYAYKFVVDGKWIADPLNPILRPDGRGNYNSYVSVGDISVFKLYGHLDAKEVKLVGNFNLWNYAELGMRVTPSGWEIHLALAPGIYEYKYVVDDKWITDPNNPYFFYRDSGCNSLISIKPNHIFKLKNYSQAEEVILTGNFNDWDKRNFKMINENQDWIFPMYLPEGKYLYNFIVDGEVICPKKGQEIAENGFSKSSAGAFILEMD